MDFTRNISFGMSGPDVRAAKERLFALGFYSSKIHEIKKDSFGNDTTAALKRFKLKNGLSNYEVIDKATWVALFVGVPKVSGLLKTIEELCLKEIENGSIYVWAASGELGINVSENWIETKEYRYNKGSETERSLRMWSKRIESGNRLFRVFDCSGFVSWILKMAGINVGRRNCDRLFDLCKRIDAPRNGALLFRVNSENSEDETHVGFYFNGYQYHCKGRDVGVVREPYKASYWHKIGWFKALEG